MNIVIASVSWVLTLHWRTLTKHTRSSTCRSGSRSSERLDTQDHSLIRNTGLKPRSALEALFLANLEFNLFHVLTFFIATPLPWCSGFLLMWLFWTSTCWHWPTGHCNNLLPSVILFDSRKHMNHPVFARCPTIPGTEDTKSVVKRSGDRH